MSPVVDSQTTMALGYVRSDTLPENTRYKDDGCDASLTCLECPLSLCKYDDPGWLQRENRRTRDDQIFRLRSEQVAVTEISKRFGISTRTVHRIVQRGGATPVVSDEEGVSPIVSLSELDERSLFHERASWPKMFTYKRSVSLGN
mgnify:FL=1